MHASYLKTIIPGMDICMHFISAHPDSCNVIINYCFTSLKEI